MVPNLGIHVENKGDIHSLLVLGRVFYVCQDDSAQKQMNKQIWLYDFGCELPIPKWRFIMFISRDPRSPIRISNNSWWWLEFWEMVPNLYLQIIATSVEVTPNGGDCKRMPAKCPKHSGLGIRHNLPRYLYMYIYIYIWEKIIDVYIYIYIFTCTYTNLERALCFAPLNLRLLFNPCRIGDEQNARRTPESSTKSWRSSPKWSFSHSAERFLRSVDQLTHWTH